MSRKHWQNLAQLEVRRIPDHKCSLPLEENQVYRHIDHGYFVECRRRLWRWVTVDSNNPDSKRYLKSAAMIEEEKMRHLLHFPRVIHPFSQFRFVWETFMIPVFILFFLLIPIRISNIELSDGMLYTKLVLDLACLIDIIICFFTGYYDKQKQIPVLSSRKIAKRYLLTYFIFDFISSQPFYLLSRWYEVENEVHMLSFYILLKCVRLPTLIRYMYKFSERKGVFTGHIKFITFTMAIAMLMTWSISFIFMIVTSLYPERRFTNVIGNFPMLMTAFSVTRMFMRVGISRVMNESMPMMIVQICCIITGFVLEILIISAVKRFYQKRATSRNKYNSLLEEIGEFMKYKELPPRLKEKIFHYLDFKYQKHIFRDEDVLDNLSSVLKHDILLQRCQRMVEKVDFFKDFPHSAMTRIVTRLRSEVFLPGDVILLAGYTGSSMYFIYKGTVAIYTEDGHEICHLDDGNHFGEIALVRNEPRVATVVAVKECELFKLSRRDFQEAIDPYPQLSRKIRMLAMQRLQRTLQMMEGSEDRLTALTADYKEN